MLLPDHEYSMKKEKQKLFTNFPPTIKWVKRARSWCKTSWHEGKQHIEFFADKPK